MESFHKEGLKATRDCLFRGNRFLRASFITYALRRENSNHENFYPPGEDLGECIFVKGQAECPLSSQPHIPEGRKPILPHTVCTPWMIRFSFPRVKLSVREVWNDKAGGLALQSHPISACLILVHCFVSSGYKRGENSVRGDFFGIVIRTKYNNINRLWVLF